jgi:hypothetical protein
VIDYGTITVYLLPERRQALLPLPAPVATNVTENEAWTEKFLSKEVGARTMAGSDPYALCGGRAMGEARSLGFWVLSSNTSAFSLDT